jgi:hypothetical protein
MSQYLLLLRDGDLDLSGASQAERDALFDRFVKWTESLHARGRLRGVERLARGGAVVRRRGGAISVDGPFAEAKEAVVGLFIVEAADAAEAHALAQECPSVAHGGWVEVRPIDAFPKPR